MSKLRHGIRRAFGAAAAVSIVAVVATADPTSASTASTQPVFAVAAVLSGSPDDAYVNESIADALDALREADLVDGHTYDYAISSPDPAAAADRIMQLGSEPWGAVVVAGPYEDAVLAAATAHPQRAFVYLPPAEPDAGLELPVNVSVITPDAEEGGAVLGAIAGALDPARIRILWNDVESVTPPGRLFNEGFVASAPAQATVDVAAPLGDLGTIDLLVVNRALSADDAASIAANDVPLLGNAADLSDVTDRVVATSVYRWDLPLREIILGVAAGDLGGNMHRLDLANGGLEIRIGDGSADHATVEAAAAAAIAEIVPPTTTPPTTTPAPATAAPTTPDTQPDATQPATGGGGTAAPATTVPVTAPSTAPPTAPATPAPTNPPAPSAGGCDGMGVGTANQWRANAGVAPLSAAGLGACSWAQQLAQNQSLSHAGGQPGEVVYSGYSCGEAWSGWAGSPSHYAVIVSADYSLGDFQCVTDSNGVVWAVGRLSW
jgi:basic membrane lipoprotein Med (substrate-binding protein (PBP1-ABC) superfamily)